MDEEAKRGGFASPGDYVSDLLHGVLAWQQREQARLEELLLEGLNSGPGEVMDDAWVENFLAEAQARLLASKAAEAGILTRMRDGRRNRYEMHAEKPLRHAVESHCMGDLLKMSGDE